MDLTRTATVDDVRAVVASTLGIEDRLDTLEAGTPLLGALPELDSMAVVELLSALEERFGLELDDEDITGEVFETIGTLAHYIDTRRG